MFSRIFRFQIYFKTFENLRRPPSLPCGHEIFGRLPSLPCGRVIGEPWKSKLNVKGWPYTHRTWSREMRVIIRWIKMHSQITILLKNSDPQRNSGTEGFINSQTLWTPNGKHKLSTKVISPPLCCHMCRSESPVYDVPKTFSKSSRLDSKSKWISV